MRLAGLPDRRYVSPMGKTELKIEIDADLLAEARAAGVSLETILEAGLRIALMASDKDRPLGVVAGHLRQAADPRGAEQRARAWAEENAEAIVDYNRRVKARGLIGDEFRKW